MVPNPVYVTEVAERKWDYPWRHVFVCPPHYSSKEEVIKWWDAHRDLSNLCVHFSKKEKAKDIVLKINQLGPQHTVEEEERLIAELKAISEPPFESLTPLQRWERTAVQMPGDIGGPRKSFIKALLTKKAHGKVLEVACGFNSYFGTSPRIQEVVASDFSRAMLERYPYPERKRILFDLERVVNGERMDFFKDGEFQTVGCCYITNYLTDPVPVFAEFNRILSPNGSVLLIENTTMGYSDRVKRYFKPEECVMWMRTAGFSVSAKRLDKIKTRHEMGDYYLVEGKKKNK